MNRVLLIDDEIEIIDVVSEYLQAERFQVTGLTHPERAVETAIRVNPEVIVVDIMMPEVDGYQVARQLKADSRTSEIPIVFLSGKDRQDDSLRFSLNDGQLYIRKPISLPELKEALLCVINQVNGARG